MHFFHVQKEVSSRGELRVVHPEWTDKQMLLFFLSQSLGRKKSQSGKAVCLSSGLFNGHGAVTWRGTVRACKVFLPFQSKALGGMSSLDLVWLLGIPLVSEQARY